MDHSSVIFLSKAPLIVDFPLPCFSTRWFLDRNITYIHSICSIARSDYQRVNPYKILLNHHFPMVFLWFWVLTHRLRSALRRVLRTEPRWREIVNFPGGLRKNVWTLEAPNEIFKGTDGKLWETLGTGTDGNICEEIGTYGNRGENMGRSVKIWENMGTKNGTLGFKSPFASVC